MSSHKKLLTFDSGSMARFEEIQKREQMPNLSDAIHHLITTGLVSYHLELPISVILDYVGSFDDPLTESQLTVFDHLLRTRVIHTVEGQMWAYLPLLYVRTLLLGLRGMGKSVASLEELQEFLDGIDDPTDYIKGLPTIVKPEWQPLIQQQCDHLIGVIPNISHIDTAATFTHDIFEAVLEREARLDKK